MLSRGQTYLLYPSIPVYTRLYSIPFVLDVEKTLFAATKRMASPTHTNHTNMKSKPIYLNFLLVLDADPQSGCHLLHRIPSIPSIPTSPSIAVQTGPLFWGYRIGAKKTWGCLKVGTRKIKRNIIFWSSFSLKKHFLVEKTSILRLETWRHIYFIVGFTALHT